MSDQSEPREQIANAEQVLETKDLELKSEETDQVRGGTIEISDYGFGVTMPTTTSRSDSAGATIKR